MGDAIDRLITLVGERSTDRVALAAGKVYVPPHVRIKNGKRQNVDGYWRKARKGEKPGSTVSPPGGAAKADAGGAKKPDAPDAPDAKSVKKADAPDKPDKPDKPKPSAERAMSDSEHAARVAEVQKRMDEALEQGLATDQQFATTVKIGDSEEYVWDADRAAAHKEILNDLYAEVFGNVPSEGKVAFSGGLGGAGKGTVLSGRGGVDVPFDTKQYGTIDPDAIKEQLAERGMVPEVEGVSPMESAALIHEESSYLAWALADMAAKDRKNMVWDITMSSEGSVRKRIEHAKTNGYEDFRAVFVDIPVETSVERALSRHRRGQDELQVEGKGFGGRFVPPDVIRRQSSERTTSINREVFETIRDQFDQWTLVDNSGASASIVEEKKAEAEARLSAALRGESALDRLLRLTGGPV